jgi:hypothetical protein
VRGPASFGLTDRLSEVRRRYPMFVITFDNAQHVWRADRQGHAIAAYTLDDLETILARNEGLDQ